MWGRVDLAFRLKHPIELYQVHGAVNTCTDEGGLLAKTGERHSWATL